MVRLAIHNDGVMSQQCRQCKTVSLDLAPYCDACGCELSTRRHELSGWQYAVWCLIAGLAPWLFEHFILGWF